MSTSTPGFDEPRQPGVGGSSPGMLPTTSRVLNLLRVVLGWSIVLVGAVIVLAAYGSRTVRQYGEQGQWGNTTATDGLRWFQVWALLCVLGTGIVLIAALRADRPRWWLLPLPITGFLLVAGNTDARLQRLLAERAGSRTYAAQIPIKAPDGGPTLDERGFPRYFEAVTGVYEVRIPDGLNVMIIGSYLSAGLIALLLTLWVAEEIYWRHRSRTAAVVFPT